MTQRLLKTFVLPAYLVLCGAVRASAGVSLASPLDCKDCSVILISIDTLRADALGAYGSKSGTSPALDRAAERGFVFLNAFSAAPNTLPSHMTAFTGLYPLRHGVKPAIDPGKLDAKHFTLAEILRKRGYKTAWSYASSYPSVDPMIACSHAGFTRGIDTVMNESMNLEPGDPTAIGWLEKNASKRFFLFMHQYRMHAPYAPTRRTLEKFGDKLDGRKYLSQENVSARLVDMVMKKPELLFSTRTLAESEVLLIEDPAARRGEISRMVHEISRKDYRPNTLRESGIFWPQFDLKNPADLNDLKTLYGINLYDVDRWFDGFYKKLEELKILDKTIVVIMSDHGEEFMEHGKFNHTQLYQECIHVPLIFMFPNARGRRIAETVSTADITPTLLHSLGLGAIPDAQGVSLKPLMEGVAYPASRAVFGNFVLSSAYSVRDSSYSYIVEYTDGLAERLYDRAADPGEARNLIDSGVPVPLEKYRRLMKSYMMGE